MGYTERHCYLCGGSFNMARLRRVGEPITKAWHGCHGYYRPSADDPEDEVEDARQPAEDGGIAHVLRDWVEGEGIDTDSECYRAGCSEADGDHAAGSLGCGNRDGYNGWKISAEEMEIMTFVQCIAIKPDDWTVEDDDEDFERKSMFMLTATSTAAPSDHSLRHVPYRHEVGGDDILISEEEGMYPFLLPFHAPCFRIYERQYKARGIEGDLLKDLWDLRDDDGDLDDFLFKSRCLDLDENRDQFYLHIPDTEYLAADPVTIPALPSLISSCIGSAEQTTMARLGGNLGGSCRDMAQSGARTTTDPFLTLPHELRLMILEALDFDMGDILRLRLVSRAFWQIPQAAFQRLVRSTMPWFWEMGELESKLHHVDWCKLWDKISTGSGGSGTSVAHIAVWKRGKTGERSKSGIYPQYLTTDEYAAHSQSYDQKQFQLEHVSRRSFKKSRRGAERVLGLINRRRIWSDIWQIIDEIERRKQD